MSGPRRVLVTLALSAAATLIGVAAIALPTAATAVEVAGRYWRS